MHAISSYRGNRPTNTQTGIDYNTLRCSFAKKHSKETWDNFTFHGPTHPKETPNSTSPPYIYRSSAPPGLPGVLDTCLSPLKVPG